MKLSTVNAFVLTIVSATALPRFNILAREDPNYVPVTLMDARNGNITCGQPVTITPYVSSVY